MSELKTLFVDDAYAEYCNTGKHDLAQVYLKSEADKVIADLEESHKMEVEQLLIEIVELKARIAELERMDTEHTLQIAKMNGYIHHLEEERRWRKASEENPMDNNNVYVILENGFETTDRYDHDKGHWHYHWHTVKYWMPLPSAPKEDK